MPDQGSRLALKPSNAIKRTCASRGMLNNRIQALARAPATG